MNNLNIVKRNYGRNSKSFGLCTFKGHWHSGSMCWESDYRYIVRLSESSMNGCKWQPYGVSVVRKSKMCSTGSGVEVVVSRVCGLILHQARGNATFLNLQCHQALDLRLGIRYPHFVKSGRSGLMGGHMVHKA